MRKSIRQSGASLSETANVFCLFRLHDAASRGDLAAVRGLLVEGVDVDATDRLGRSALHKAALAGHESVVSLLLDAGADLNLRDADYPSHPDDVHIPPIPRTPLVYAIEGKHLHLVRLCLERGATTATSNEYQVGALHEAALLGCCETVQCLLDQNADPNAAASVNPDLLNRICHHRGWHFHMPLYFAAVANHLAVLNLLVRHGADVDGTPTDEAPHGVTALHDACSSGHVDVVRALLDYGADPERECSHRARPLHYAALNGSPEIVKMLLERGVLVDSVTVEGDTPLHYAAGQGHQAVCQILVAHGAALNARNRKGESVSDKAKQAGLTSPF